MTAAAAYLTVAQAITAVGRRQDVPEPIPLPLQIALPAQPKRRAKARKRKPAPKPAQSGRRVSASAKRAHEALDQAEAALLAEKIRPTRSREHFERLAHGYEVRAAAWQLLSRAEGVDDRFGHTRRALLLAAEADSRRALVLRKRLEVIR